MKKKQIEFIMTILIKNGTIIDGTGSKGYKADILIEGDKIKEIRNEIDVNGAEIIDARNKVVSPGFIDMHSHADISILDVNTTDATIVQGVTTLVVGMCGLGLAPANDKVRKYYSIFVTKVFGSFNMELYDTFQDYFNMIEKKGISSNVAFFIPQGNVRTCVLGMDDREATAEELEEMRRMVREGMEAGAFGLSSGLIYAPGSITSTSELIELCKVVSEYDGIYDSHMRNEGTGILDKGMGELIDIARKSKVKAQISHWKAGSNFAWKLTPDMINLVKQARNEGLIIHADVYPYEASSTSLSGALLKPWVYENFKENLTNPEIRKRIIDETLEIIDAVALSDVPWYVKLVPKFLVKKIVFSIFKKSTRIISVMHEHHIEGKTLGESLDILYPKKSFVDALLDFFRDEEGSIMISMKQMSEKKSILELIKQDFVCIGSDGFIVKEGNTHPRSSGTFPKILGNYVREKNIFSLEEGVHKMTGLTASILGLKDRGIIKENFKADIVIFDPETIIDKATYTNGRLPPEGIEHVIINGEITVSNGAHQGTLNGQILKHQ